MRRTTHPMNGFMRRAKFRGSRRARSTWANPGPVARGLGHGRNLVGRRECQPRYGHAGCNVYACVRVLATMMASLPLHMYRRIEGGKEPAPEHPLQAILHRQPNWWQSSAEWRPR